MTLLKVKTLAGKGDWLRDSKTRETREKPVVTVPVPFSSGPYRIRLVRRKKGDRHRAMHVVFPGNIGDSARSQSPFLRLPFSLCVPEDQAVAKH